MGKWYAYCPRGYIEMIEKRTEKYDEPYPIAHFYHGALLPFFREIPDNQKEEVRKLWYWDDTDNCFKEPHVGEEINGEIYLGVVRKEDFWQMLEDNFHLKEEYEQIKERLTMIEQKLGIN